MIHKIDLNNVPLWQQKIIQEFNPDNKEKIDPTLRPQFPFPNDRNFFPALESVPTNKKYESEDNIVMVTGDSYLLSSLPLLVEKSRAKTIFVCDIDPELLTYITFYSNILLSATNELEFTNALTSLENPFIHNEQEGLLFLSAYESQKKAIGKHHCFYNEKNFEQCKKAHRETTLIPVCINLFDSTQVTNLANRISGKIFLLNLTNLREWDKEDALGTTLKLLPLVNEPVILSASHRETFGFGNQQPKTEAIIGSIGNYNNTFIETVLFRTFIRPRSQNAEICEEILKGVNHINTPGNDGYAPLQVAAFDFLSPLSVSLLLKYGANIPKNLSGNLEKEIAQYYYPNTIKVEKEIIIEIEKTIRQNGLRLSANVTKEYHSNDFYYFSEIGEHSIIFTDNDTHIINMHANSMVVVTNGNVFVENAGNNCSLQTLNGSIIVHHAEKNIRIVSSNDVTLETNCSGTTDIIAHSSIQTEDIGASSYLLAGNKIHTKNLGNNALVLSSSDTIHVDNTSYGVFLGTTNADILIDGNLPHAGKLSIEGKGEIHYHRKNRSLSGASVIFNTDNTVRDLEFEREKERYVNRFFKLPTFSFKSKIHGDLIINLCFKWHNLLTIKPLYSLGKSHDFTSENALTLQKISSETLYADIIDILNLTPAGIVSKYPGSSMSSWSIQGLNVPSFSAAANDFINIFSQMNERYIQSSSHASNN